MIDICAAWPKFKAYMPCLLSEENGELNFLYCNIRQELNFMIQKTAGWTTSDDH